MVELGAPDDPLLGGVLVKLFSDRQLDVGPAAIDYLERRMERSLEAARRLVAAVDREALATRERIGTRLAAAAVLDVRRRVRPLTKRSPGVLMRP